MLRYSLWILTVFIACFAINSPLHAQTYGDRVEAPVEPKEYHESALRRFEIIFQVSLPFTALHSYAAVRVAEMIRQNKVSPKFSRGDWNTVGVLTLAFSGAIGLWDYMHTREKDIKDMSVPRQTELLEETRAGSRDQTMSSEPTLKLLSSEF